MKRCLNCNSRKIVLKEGEIYCQRCDHSYPYHTTKIMSGSRIGGDKPQPQATYPDKISRIEYQKNQFKYPIKRDNPGKHLSIIRPFKNSYQEWEYGEGWKVQRTTKSIIVSIDSELKDIKRIPDLDRVLLEIRGSADEVAKTISQMLDIELNFNAERIVF